MMRALALAGLLAAIWGGWLMFLVGAGLAGKLDGDFTLRTLLIAILLTAVAVSLVYRRTGA